MQLRVWITASETLLMNDANCLHLRFKAHGKWINPMRDPTQATETDATVELGVRALDFEGSGLKNGAVRKLAHILRVNTTVTRLNLSWNEIGSKGATYLADSLVKNCTLTHLDLRYVCVRFGWCF